MAKINQPAAVRERQRPYGHRVSRLKSYGERQRGRGIGPPLNHSPIFGARWTRQRGAGPSRQAARRAHTSCMQAQRPRLRAAVARARRLRAAGARSSWYTWCKLREGRLNLKFSYRIRGADNGCKAIQQTSQQYNGTLLEECCTPQAARHENRGRRACRVHALGRVEIERRQETVRHSECLAGEI